MSCLSTTATHMSEASSHTHKSTRPFSIISCDDANTQQTHNKHMHTHTHTHFFFLCRENLRLAEVSGLGAGRSEHRLENHGISTCNHLPELGSLKASSGKVVRAPTRRASEYDGVGTSAGGSPPRSRSKLRRCHADELTVASS